MRAVVNQRPVFRATPDAPSSHRRRADPPVISGVEGTAVARGEYRTSDTA